jgi:hypothetical protein
MRTPNVEGEAAHRNQAVRRHNARPSLSMGMTGAIFFRVEGRCDSSEMSSALASERNRLVKFMGAKHSESAGGRALLEVLKQRIAFRNNRERRDADRLQID